MISQFRRLALVFMQSSSASTSFAPSSSLTVLSSLTTTLSSTSATLAALTSPDILDHILENLTLAPFTWSLPIEEVLTKRKALRNAALVNKMYWLEPSLDRLWKSLDKFFPLFRLLRAFEKSDLIYVSVWSFHLAEFLFFFVCRC